MIEDQLDMNNLPIDRPGRRSTVAEQLGVAPTENKFLQATSGRLDTFAEEPMSNQESFQFFPNQDREDIRARYQSVPELFGKALWNSAVEIGAGAAEGVGYLADVKGIWDSFTQQETEYGNWFSDIAKQAKESMSADIKLTQEAREDFAPTDATWWASNAPSVASAISLAIPAMGAVRGLTAISKIGSLGRVNKLVKSVGTANKIAGTSSAVLSRYMENTMEASETFDSTYNELISQGLSDEDAKAKAGLAARDSWNSNWVNLAFDVVQFNMLGKGVNAANINSKDLAKSLGKSMAGKGAALAGNMVQEGVEEGIQYVVGQEAKRAQTEEGAAYFDKGLFESFSEYIDDPEMKTSMFFGALGGGVFNAGGGAIDAHFKKKSDKLADAYLEKQKALDSNDYTKASDIDTSEFMQTAYAHAETGKMNDFKDKLTVELNKTDAELTAEGKNESQIAEHRKIFQNLVEDADYVGSEFSRIQDVRGKDNKLKQKELFTLYHRRVKERSLADINEKIGKVKAGATLPMMEAIELSSLNVFEAIRINTTNKNQKIDNHERVGEVVKRRKKQLQDSLEASAKAMDLSVDEYIKTLPVAEAELQKMIAQKVSTQMTLESLNGTLKDINDPAKEADVLNNINNTRKEAILATISPEMGIDQLNQFISDPQVSKDVIAKVDELTKDANKHIPSGDNVYGQIDRRYNGSNLALSKDLKNIAFLTSDIKNIEDFKTKYSNNNLFKQAVDSYYKSLLKDTASSGVTFGEDVDSNANQPDDEDSFLPSQSKTLTFDVSVVSNNDTALVRLSSDNPSIVEVIGYKIDGIDAVKGITRIPLSSAEKLFKLKSINSSRWNILYDIDGRVISSQNNIIELEDGTTIPLMTVEEQQNLDNPDFSFKGKQIRLETVPNAKWGKKKGFDKMLILVKYEHEGQWLTAGMLKSINKNASTPIEQKILDIRQNIFNSQETTFDFDIKIKERTTGNIVKGMDQPVTALLAAGQPLMLGVILPNEDGTYQISYGGNIDIDTSLVEYNPSSMMGYYEGNTVTFIKTPKGTYVPMKLKTAKLSEFPDELNKVYKLIESFKEGDDIVELNSNLQELTFLTLKRLSDNTWSYEFLKNTGEKGYSEPMTQEALFNYIKENKAIRINKDKINNGNYNASVAKFLRSDITLAPLKTRGASLVLSFDKVNLGTTTQPVAQSTTTVAQNVPAKIEEVINNKNFIKGKTKDGKLVDIDSGIEYVSYYNTKTGKDLTRVSNVISDEDLDKDNPIIKSSTTIGSKVDKLVRDFFANTLKPLEQYEVADVKIIEEFLKSLAVVKEAFDNRGEVVLANDIILYNDELGIAGTVDLLTYDAKGDVRIYDMKTMRGDNFKDDGYGSKYDSTAVFEKTGETKPNGEPKYRIVKGVTQDSKRTKHSKQLSLYRILLNNTHGVKAKTLGIIPIEVWYKGGDTTTSVLKKLEGVKLNILDKVEGAELKDSTPAPTTATKPAVVNTPLGDTIVATENTQNLLEVFNLPDTTSAVMADVPVKATEAITPAAPVSGNKTFIEKEIQEANDRIVDIENNLLPKINNRLDNNLQPELNKLYEKLRNTKDPVLQKEINDEIDRLSKQKLTKRDILDLTNQKEAFEGQIESAKKFIVKKNSELAALNQTAPVFDIETKKADIEKRRSSSLRNINQSSLNFDAGRGYVGKYNIPGTEIIDSNGKPSGLFKTEIIREDTKEEVEKEINAKYDAELAALETSQAGSVGVWGDVESTAKALEEIKKLKQTRDKNLADAEKEPNTAPTVKIKKADGSVDTNSIRQNAIEAAQSLFNYGIERVKNKYPNADLKAVEQSIKETPTTTTEDIEARKAEIENEKSIAVKELLQSQEKQREQAKKQIKEVTDTGSSDAGSTNRGNIALLGTLDNAVRRLEDTFDKRLNELLTNDEKINDIEIAYVYFSDYKKYELQTKDLNRRDKKRISILIDRIGDGVVEILLKDNKINRDKEDSNLFKDLNGKNLGDSASVVKILYGKNSPTVSEIKDKLIAELNTLEQSAPTTPEVKKDIDPNTGKERISRTRRNRVANSNVTQVWNKEVEMAWFKKNYPNTPVTVLADLSHIAETGGMELWGMYENAAIYMAENAGRGTLYHEAFHLVFNSMLTEKERISLLKQVKVKGTALDKEEFLSDGFSDHMLDERLSEGLSDSIRDFFKRLYHIISIVAERLGLKKDATIDEMFYRASKGIYNNFPKFKRDVTMFKKNLYGELNPSEATSAAKIIADSIINEVIPSLRDKYKRPEKDNDVDPEKQYATSDTEDVDILNMSMAKDKKGDADGYSIKGLFKTVYDFLQSDYEELPDGSFDKEVLGRVIKSMLTENADGTITYRALMQLAISKLSSYGLKLNPNGFDTIERTIDETIEETDTDEVGESKVKESYGNSDKFTSAKDNFRGRSLRLMSSIPFANKTFASKQMYHEFSYIYSTLQEELVDSVSIEQMMEKLEDLYSITPEFRMISDEFVKDPTLKTEFWNNFGQRISAPFRTIKKERDGNFHTFETNRVGVKRDIISDWQYFFENNNDLYNETEGVKDIPGIKEDIDFLNNLSKIYNNELRRDDGLDSDDIVRLSEVLFKIGIPFNEPKLRSVLSLNSEESTKSGARLAIDLIKGYDNKGLLFVLNQLANKKSPFVDSIDSVKATQSVASILVKMFPTMRQTSFLNGENKQVNSNVAPRQSFRFVNLLKSSKQRADAILTERMKDPFFSRMPLFKMIKEEDRLRQKMSLEIFDTLKDVKGKGIPYSTLTRRQFDAIRFNMWYNRAKDFTKDGNTIYGKETNDAFYGLPIPSDSTSYTVFKFVKLTHSEARKGIIDAVRQEYDRILDLQNKITPYQKEYDAWRNGTLSNQDLPAALKKIPYSLLANGLNYHIFPALNGQTITDYNLTEKVNPLIDQVIKDEISSLIKEGVIDAAFTNVNGSLDARIFAEKFDTKSLIEQYVLNSMFMNTQLTFMFGNDIAYYKPVVKKVGSNKTKTGEVQTEDFFKRIKQIWSPGTYLDTNAKFIDEAGVTHGVRESYKVAYIEDVEIPSEQIQKIVGLFETEAEKAFVRDKYESMNISDAFTIIDPFRYREVMISSAQWSHAHEKQYNHIINGRVVPANELVVFQPIKPFMFENVWVDGKWVPTQHKNAEMLLIPQMAIGNPIFQNALEKMGWVFNTDGSYRFDVSKRNVDAILFNSSVKVGEMMTLKSISDIDSSNTQSFNNNNYRIQMGTPEHFMDSNITFGTQYRKLILEGIQMSSIYTFSDGSTKTGAEIFKLYNDAIELNLSEGLSNVEKIFKNADGSINYDSMLNEIRKYVMEKDLGSDYLEALRWLDPNNKRGGTVLPFYHPSISYNLEAILNSFYKNNVTKQEANGMALYNTSSYGYSDTGKLRKPKIVFAEDGKSIKYVEAIIPIQSKELLEEFLGEDGFVDINKVPEVLKEGLFYRIPTEDKYSMVHIRVIGYFPSQVGAQIVLPDEITTKAGLDFDIDKMYGFMMNHYKDSKTGKFNKVKSGLESKKARQNLMLDIGIAIMSHESSAASQMRPGNFDNLKEIRDEIIKAQGKSSVKLNFALPSTHTEVQSRNMTGGKLIGPFANHRVNHVLMGFGNFMIAKDRGIKFNGVEKNNLSTNTSADGKLIGSKLASFVAAVVDNAKDPLASFFNLTMTFSDTVATIVRSGHTERTALRFIAQPVMMEFTSRFSNSDNTGTLNAIALMREMIDEEYALVNDPNMVNQLLQSIELTDDNLLEQIAKENSTELTTASDKLGIVAYRIKTLGQMVEIMEVADELNKVMSAMRYDSMGKAAGPSYADTLIKVRSYDKLIKKSNLVTGLAEFNEIPWVKSFYEKGVATALERIIEVGNYPYKNEVFSDILTYFEDRKTNGSLTANEINSLIRSIMTALTSMSPIYNAKKSNELLTSFPKRFMQYKKDNPAGAYSNLTNLMSIDKAAKNDGRYSKPYDFLIFNRSGIDSQHMQSLKDTWNEMLNSSKEEERLLANDLAIYAFVTSGFVFSSNALTDLIPVTHSSEMRENVNSESVNEFMKKSFFANHSEALLTQIQNQILRNFYQSASYVKEVDITKYKLQKNEGKLFFVVEDYLTDSNLVRAFYSAIKDDSGKIVSYEQDFEPIPYFRARADKGSIKSDPILMMPRKDPNSNRVIFMEQEPLGVPNRIVQFDLQNDIVVQVGQSNPFIEDAVYEDVTEAINQPKKITTGEISYLIKLGEIIYLDENKKPCKNWTK